MATLLMASQAEAHGRPIESGFYEASLLKGNHRSSYLLSKYVKDFLFNMLMLGVLNLTLLIFGLRLTACLELLILWAAVNPFFVYALSY